MLVDETQMGERFRVLGLVRWLQEETKTQFEAQVPGFIDMPSASPDANKT